MRLLTTLQRSEKDHSEPIHVGIIGGGISGLRCADILDQYGFKVTILEGRDRLGGRVHQTELPNGHLVDLGPNWIHGTQENPMLEIAKDTHTAIGHWDSRSYVFDENGTLMPLEIGERYSKIMWDIILDAFRHSNKCSVDIHPDESLWDFFLAHIGVKIPSTEEEYEAKRALVLQMAEMWGAFVGSPIERQSLKYFWLEECIEGGMFDVLSSPKLCLFRGAFETTG
jgi:hypothetical protein